MDQNPLGYLDYVTDTGELVDNETFNAAVSSGDYSKLSPINPETGDLLNTIPVNSPGMPTPATTPPPSGYAWFYTTNNDRVPVALSAIPSYYFQYLSADQVNIPAQSLTQQGAPMSAGLASVGGGGMALWLLLGVGAYFLLKK